MAPINVGFIGYGVSAKIYHLPYIVPNADLKIHSFLQRASAPSSEVNTKPGQHITVDYPDAKHYQTAEEFFADPEIDLVVVCTGAESHAEFAERALSSGKHVVVEKPFVITTEEADRLIAKSKNSGKILTVFQNRRYDADFKTLKYLVEKSAFGQVTEFEVHYDIEIPPWIASWTSPDYEPGNGMPYGLGSHTIDQALLLFGRPASITGFYRSLRGVVSKTDDTFIIVMQYAGEKSNLLVTVKTTVVTSMKSPLKYMIRGLDGSYLKLGDDVQEHQVWAGQKADSEGFGVEPSDIHGLLTTKTKFSEAQDFDEGCQKWVGKFPSFRGDYMEYYRDVVRAIRGEQEVAVKPEESRDGIRVIELARESADRGITLPFDGDKL